MSLVDAYPGKELWQLLWLLTTNFNPRRMAAQTICGDEVCRLKYVAAEYPAQSQLVSVLDGKALMAVRGQSVQCADIALN
jgi:hypothetical protein